MSVLMCSWIYFQIRPVFVSNFLLPTPSMVNRSSVVKVQTFNQRKLQRRNQGFLGSVEIRVTDYLDLELGGQGTFSGFRVACPF